MYDALTPWQAPGRGNTEQTFLVPAHEELSLLAGKRASRVTGAAQWGAQVVENKEEGHLTCLQGRDQGRA